MSLPGATALRGFYDQTGDNRFGPCTPGLAPEPTGPLGALSAPGFAFVILEFLVGQQFRIADNAHPTAPSGVSYATRTGSGPMLVYGADSLASDAARGISVFSINQSGHGWIFVSSDLGYEYRLTGQTGQVAGEMRLPGETGEGFQVVALPPGDYTLEVPRLQGSQQVSASYIVVDLPSDATADFAVS
jgi:hypothetical protein